MPIATDADTIVAIASASGAGSVGVVRISGSKAKSITLSLSGRQQLQPRHAHYCLLRSPDGQELDSGLVIYFPAPHSFTGEDVAELQVHGNDYILAEICAQAQALGARYAQPGEYSRRAFINGNMDLAQAEAIADLISSQSRSAALAASRSLQGQLSRQVSDLEQAFTGLRAWVEASLDFPDEEVDYIDFDYLHSQLQDLQQRLEQLLQRCRAGIKLQQGAQLVLCGEPNVGKSSIMNALLEYKRAIVSAQAGTTRDLINAEFDLGGLRLSLSDTAGLRATTDGIEQEGIALATQAIDSADLLLIVSTQNPDLAQLAQNYSYAQLQRALLLVNKIDLSAQAANRTNIDYSHPEGDLQLSCVYLSAKTGAGLDLLRAAIGDIIQLDSSAVETALSARARHLEHLQAAREQLHQAQNNRATELAAEHLRTASEQLQAITGSNPSESLLDAIFSQFCLGK